MLPFSSKNNELEFKFDDGNCITKEDNLGIRKKGDKLDISSKRKLNSISFQKWLKTETVPQVSFIMESIYITCNRHMKTLV